MPGDPRLTQRPRIAVVAYHLADDRVPRWPRGGFGVPAPYIDALRRAGALALIVSPGETSEPAEILDRFDGLMLVGGGDVDPSLYGGDPGAEHIYGVEPDRDRLEIALLHEANGRNLPTLCICRGMQVMNIAFGGSLQRHLPDVPGLIDHGVPTAGTESLHSVTLEPRSRTGEAAGVEQLVCSSHHHQGVDRLGEGLRVSGRSPDGLIEAIEAEGEGWMIGLEWHPEETATQDPAQQAFFDRLAGASSI
jgi:putative glutamine amidotransferase